MIADEEKKETAREKEEERKKQSTNGGRRWDIERKNQRKMKWSPIENWASRGDNDK